MKVLFSGAALALATVAGPADAAVTLVLEQSGANVVARASGSLNLTGMTPTVEQYVSDNPVGAGASFPVLSIGDRSVVQNRYFGFTGPARFGTGDTFIADASSGVAIYFNGDGSIYLQAAYVSGAALNATMTFNNRTLSQFGITQSVYRLTSGDTFTISEAAVPELASWAMMIGGLGLIGGAMRRRAKVRVSTSYA